MVDDLNAARWVASVLKVDPDASSHRNIFAAGSKSWTWVDAHGQCVDIAFAQQFLLQLTKDNPAEAEKFYTYLVGEQKKMDQSMTAAKQLSDLCFRPAQSRWGKWKRGAKRALAIGLLTAAFSAPATEPFRPPQDFRTYNAKAAAPLTQRFIVEVYTHGMVSDELIATIKQETVSSQQDLELLMYLLERGCMDARIFNAATGGSSVYDGISGWQLRPLMGALYEMRAGAKLFRGLVSLGLGQVNYLTWLHKSGLLTPAVLTKVIGNAGGDFLSATPQLKSDLHALIERELAIAGADAEGYSGKKHTSTTDDLKNHYSDMLEDPALENLLLIKDEWLPQLPRDELAELKARIARNLNFQRKAVTLQAVHEEQQRIALEREQLASLPLFQGRSVVLIGAEETVLWDGKMVDRFLPQAVIDAVRAQAADVTVFKFTTGNIKTLKPQLLDTIARIKGPLTILIDGHGLAGKGRAGAITLVKKSPDAPWGEQELTEFDLQDALKKRWDAVTGGRQETAEKIDIAKRDIIISASCYSSNILRELLAWGVPTPILIANAEYGQYGMTNYNSPFHSNFLEFGIGLGSGHPSTLGDVFRNESSKRLHGNITVYCPMLNNSSHSLQQIARADSGRPV